MVDVLAINRVLPAIGVQTDNMADIIGQTPGNMLALLVPPAGWMHPAVEPKALFRFALIEAGSGATEAEAHAAEWATDILARLPLQQRPFLLGWGMGLFGAPCVPLPDALAALKAHGGRLDALAQAILQFAEEAAAAPLFVYGEFGKAGRSLRELGTGPLATGMTEFMPGIYCCLLDLSNDDPEMPARLDKWREEIMPIIAELEAKAGTQLYHFAIPGAVPDDDLAHRFLALDCICTLFPQANFVRYIVEIAGATSAQHLRHALQHPSSYALEFRLYDAFLGPQIDKFITYKLD
ncbi:MAG: hypothetical protein P4L66_01225 [Acetobacteraceae bacterium]|nr:hypothetical protein [Acetobacteraceae bacterium]